MSKGWRQHGGNKEAMWPWVWMVPYTSVQEMRLYWELVADPGFIKLGITKYLRVGTIFGASCPSSLLGLRWTLQGPIGELWLSYGYVWRNPFELHLYGHPHCRYPLYLLVGCQHLWEDESVHGCICHHISIVVGGRVLEWHCYDKREWKCCGLVTQEEWEWAQHGAPTMEAQQDCLDA